MLADATALYVWLRAGMLDGCGGSKDGYCSLVGAVLSAGIIVSCATYEYGSDKVWWIDAVVAVSPVMPMCPACGCERELTITTATHTRIRFVVCEPITTAPRPEPFRWPHSS